MRLFLTTESREMGGAEQQLAQLATSLRARGHDVLVAVPATPALTAFAASLEAMGLRVARRHAVPPDPARFSWAACREYRAMLRAWRPDVAHTLLPYPTFNTAFMLAAALTRTPFVAQFCLVPATPFMSVTRERLRRAWLRGLWGRAAALVPVSRGNLRRLQATVAVPAPRWRVLPNARNFAQYAHGDPAIITQLRAELALDGVVLMTIARFHEQKGYDVLMAAFAALCRRTTTPVSLVCVGDGPTRAAIEAQAREAGVADRVRFAGVRTCVPELLALSDVFVLPSRYEGMPFSLLEAMSAGRAVVATDIDGSNEVVEPERSGVLVPVDDPDALAHALQRLVDDPARRAAFAAGARERVQTAFSEARMLDELEAIYVEAARR